MSVEQLPKNYDGIVTPADWICSHCGQPRGAHACAFHRPKVDFAAMLRVKNESRWIAEVIQSLLPLCDRVFVFDDHSEDDTKTITQQQGSAMRVFSSPFSGLNEARDKNWLYDRVIAECEPRWVLCIDGDEVLEKRGPQEIRNWCAIQEAPEFAPLGPGATSGKFKIEYLWNDPQTVRVDRIYGDFWRPSLFRPFHADPDKPDDLKVLAECRWRATPFGRKVDGNEPNLHCSSVPQRFIHGAKMVPVRLKHYGYMERAQRVAKMDWYTSIDWHNESEGHYLHMIQGDRPSVSELPRVAEMIQRGILGPGDVIEMWNVETDTRLLHAGPIELRPWDESAPWEMSEWARRQV